MARRGRCGGGTFRVLGEDDYPPRSADEAAIERVYVDARVESGAAAREAGSPVDLDLRRHASDGLAEMLARVVYRSD